MAKSTSRAKLKSITKSKKETKPKTKGVKLHSPPPEEAKAINTAESILNAHDLYVSLKNRALVALRIEDHLHAIAAEVLNSGTSRKDRTNLFGEFEMVLSWAPPLVQAKVIEELEFMLKEPEKPKESKTTSDKMDDAILGGVGSQDVLA